MSLAELKTLTTQIVAKDREIRQAKEEWERTFDAVVDLILIIDTNFVIKRCNKAFLDFFGAEEYEILGMKCYEYLHKDKGPLPNCPHIKSMSTLQISRRTAKFKDRYFEITCTPIIDTLGEVSGIVHLMHDVTDLKIMSDHLNESNINLEAYIQELLATVDELKNRMGENNELINKMQVE